MKAIIANGYGSSNVLNVQEIAEPKPQDNEIKVKVSYANISKADAMMRTGKPYFARLFLGLTRPKHETPGTGFAGKIVEVGTDVTDFQVGDCVYGESTQHFGAHAEYVCLGQSELVRKIPSYLDPSTAAPICDGPLTAYNFLFAIADLQPNQHIVINGASGSIGSSAVQLAKIRGAKVTAICSAKNHDLVHSLGTDAIVHYDKQDINEALTECDVFFDTVGSYSFKQVKTHLNRQGIFMSPVLSLSLLFNMIRSRLMGGRQVRFSATGLLSAKVLSQFLNVIESNLNDNQLKILIDQTYEPEQIQHAHDYIDSNRKKGSVLLKF